MASEIIPDVFHWVELGRIGGQRHQRDVVGDRQPFAFLVPSSAVADQQAMRAGGNLGADFGEMLIHRLDVHPGMMIAAPTPRSGQIAPKM